MSIVLKEPCPACKDNPGKSADGKIACPVCGGTKERQTTMPFERFVSKVAEALRSARGSS